MMDFILKLGSITVRALSSKIMLINIFLILVTTIDLDIIHLLLT